LELLRDKLTEGLVVRVRDDVVDNERVPETPVDALAIVLCVGLVVQAIVGLVVQERDDVAESEKLAEAKLNFDTVSERLAV
jgi:hypothetical protein